MLGEPNFASIFKFARLDFSEIFLSEKYHDRKSLMGEKFEKKLWLFLGNYWQSLGSKFSILFRASKFFFRISTLHSCGRVFTTNCWYFLVYKPIDKLLQRRTKYTPGQIKPNVNASGKLKSFNEVLIEKPLTNGFNLSFRGCKVSLNVRTINCANGSKRRGVTGAGSCCCRYSYGRFRS